MNPLVVGSLGVWTWAAAFTGTATIMENVGRYSTTETLTGIDARTPQGHGTLSLVVPHLTFAYAALGPTSKGAGTTTPTSISEGSAGAFKIVLKFTPEPGPSVLLGTGALALIAFAYMRERYRRRALTVVRITRISLQ